MFHGPRFARRFAALLPLGLAATAAAATGADTCGPSRALSAYAHNDYRNAHPVEDALSLGYLGVEAEIGREGIVKVVETPLTDGEKALLVEAYEAVKAKQADIKDL